MPYAIVRMQFGNYSGERKSWIQVHKDGSLVKRDETYSAGESEYTSQIPTVLNELETDWKARDIPSLVLLLLKILFNTHSEQCKVFTIDYQDNSSCVQQ